MNVTREDYLEAVARGAKEAMVPVAEVELLRKREFLSPVDVERLFGIPRSSLEKMRKKGTGPGYSQRKEASAIWYRGEDVKSWLAIGRVRTVDQA